MIAHTKNRSPIENQEKSAKTKYISNFAGFFPSDNPQIVGVVVINEPKYGFHWGGIGAAPVFRRVVKRIINMDDSIQILKDKYHKQKPSMLADDVFEPNNFPIKPIFTKAVYIDTDQYSNSMPDVRGMSLLQAKVILREMGYKIKFSGSGQVAWQSPKPGADIVEGSTCIIGLQ